MRDVAVVVGYRADAVEARKEALEDRHGVRLTLVHNDKAAEWNNCYSLWLARDHFAQGALLVNGDTVHPVEVERRLLAARDEEGAPGVLLALDDQKVLAEEEMKVTLDAKGRVQTDHEADGSGRRERRVHRCHAHRGARRAGARRSA